MCCSCLLNFSHVCYNILFPAQHGLLIVHHVLLYVAHCSWYVADVHYMLLTAHHVLVAHILYFGYYSAHVVLFSIIIIHAFHIGSTHNTFASLL